ncbi:MAG: peptidoglycan-binding protein, partial [Clostridia bacterium]|nr:peptidoglycan-binding protein [Clostridia bacterium]
MKRIIQIGAVTLALFALGLAYALFTVGRRIQSDRAVNAANEAAMPAAVLKQGATGGEVSEVQRRLKQWGYYTGAVDGVYGAATKKAVMSFQAKNGLTADGVVGVKTYEALGMNASYQALKQNYDVTGGNKSSSSAPSDYTSTD